MRLILSGIIVLLTGCSATYNYQNIQENASALSKNQGVCISIPVNGEYGPATYQQSGTMTANAIKSEFSKYSNNVVILENCIGQECWNLITDQKYTYLVCPEILHWEERATEWSGRPDQIEVKIAVYSTSDKKLLSSTIFHGKSKWFTFGGDHPQDLLAKPIKASLENLYLGKKLPDGK